LCVFLLENVCKFIIVCLYMYLYCGWISNYPRMGWDPINRFSPAHFWHWCNCCPSLCKLSFNQRLSRACIVHLVIKRTNWSYVKTMSCSGSRLGITINIKNTKFVKDLPMIDAQFRFNQCNSFNIFLFSHVLILWSVVAAILDFRSA
jgi:hypothetical protein